MTIFGPTNAQILAEIRASHASLWAAVANLSYSTSVDHQTTRNELRQTKQALLNAIANVAGAVDRLYEEVCSEMGHIQEKLDALKAEIDPLTSAVDGLVALIDGIAQQLEEHKDDPAEIQEVIDSIRAQKDKLVAAVVKHTPVDPEEPEEPVDPEEPEEPEEG